MDRISKILPGNPLIGKWVIILLTVLLAGLITLWGIYEVGQYGIALFILTPFFIGAFPTLVYRYYYSSSYNIAFEALGIFTIGLLAFAIEGIICVVMAAPLGLLFTWLGSIIGNNIFKKLKSNSASVLFLVFIIIPLTAFIEKSATSENIVSVTTRVEVDAPADKVWANVISFPKLKEPDEFLFKAGISYPISADINGNSVGAIRKCNFSTGSFVEPITMWDKPNLLAFDVEQCPPPMTEISFWDINAPHLHDYFVSKKGQFKLIKVNKNKTILEGTTWYYNKIKPAFYWQLWSNHIIHKIHNRVLNHIKVNAEQSIISE